MYGVGLEALRAGARSLRGAAGTPDGEQCDRRAGQPVLRVEHQPASFGTRSNAASYRASRKTQLVRIVRRLELTHALAGWFLDEEYVHQLHAGFIKNLVVKGGRAAVGSHGQFQGLGYWELWSMGQAVCPLTMHCAP